MNSLKKVFSTKSNGKMFFIFVYSNIKYGDLMWKSILQKQIHLTSDLLYYKLLPMSHHCRGLSTPGTIKLTEKYNN